MSIAPLRRILSAKEAGHICCLHERTCVRKGKDADDDFPVPIKLSENRVGFYEDEIYNWLESRRMRPEPAAA